MANETRSAQLLIRVQPSLKATMEKAARDEARSLSGFVEKVVSDWLRDRNYLDPKPRELPHQPAKDDPERGDDRSKTVGDDGFALTQE